MPEPSFEEWLERRKKKRESRRRWRTENFESESERKKRYRARYPEKVKARAIAYKALKTGIIKKPEQCDQCHLRPAVESHHEDYSKPLDVMWVCRKCHAWLDRRKAQ